MGNWSRMSRCGGTAVMIAALAVLPACGGTTVTGAVPTPSATVPRTPTPKPPTPTPTPPEERVFMTSRSEVSVRAQEGVATVTVRGFSWQRTENGPYAKPPKNRYLVLDVLITATEGKVQANPLYFSLRTPHGAEIAPVLGLDGNEPVLASKELIAPASVSGLVTFDTAQGNVALLITDELGNSVGEIAIPSGLPDENEPAEGGLPAEGENQPGDGNQPAESPPGATPTTEATPGTVTPGTRPGD
ncbi:MAG TPA: hypothetical protein GXZ30_00120 [Propionibacterium sp.]|nr:hypothetical protein [Propionibacterium sp.]